MKIECLAHWNMLLFFYFLNHFNGILAWQAFADQEAIPTLPDTSLNSELQIPNLEYISTCDIASTSFQKLSWVISSSESIACLFLIAVFLRNPRAVRIGPTMHVICPVPQRGLQYFETLKVFIFSFD
jgi:hypothetical protein